YAIAFKSWYLAGKLPDDVCWLINTISNSLSPKDVRAIDDFILQHETALFDTHPAPRDRVASARQENAVGVFALDGPAMLLFKEFRKTSKAVSLDFFKEILGTGVKRELLVPASSFLADTVE